MTNAERECESLQRDAARRYPRNERTAPSGRVCPTCNATPLTFYEARKGYQCPACTARDEGAF